MTFSVRLLRPGDEGIIHALAIEDADFDVEGRGRSLEPLSPFEARDYLNNPSVLHWVALEQDSPVGFLVCIVIPLRAGSGRELLLYEVGVRINRRRQGIGRALLKQMREWMGSNEVTDVWVLADNPEAVEFYSSCGFTTEQGLSVYMVSLS